MTDRITANDKIIQDLKEKVVEISYSESLKSKRPKTKIDKNAVWKKAQEVGKHLNDDYLPSTTPSRA